MRPAIVLTFACCLLPTLNTNAQTKADSAFIQKRIDAEIDSERLFQREAVADRQDHRVVIIHGD